MMIAKMINDGFEYHTGDNVRAERSRRGWSRAELGKRAKISGRTVWLLEDSGRCSLNTIQKIAAAMQVEPGALITPAPSAKPDEGQQ